MSFPSYLLLVLRFCSLNSNFPNNAMQIRVHPPHTREEASLTLLTSFIINLSLAGIDLMKSQVSLSLNNPQQTHRTHEEVSGKLTRQLQRISNIISGVVAVFVRRV
jgi:hypothetical protein